ncbi:unnamed protein product [Heligmosomoides polygyrus]|uniref:Peptidase M12A domain-containing protein n=1 Tax=Heligmosomoides polygyrus TaxID=6339 RepID=A0A3P7Y9Z1_HELPZ|nr:unnamed protein product [Heligmosomoides polygyrus]
MSPALLLPQPPAQKRVGGEGNADPNQSPLAKRLREWTTIRWETSEDHDPYKTIDRAETTREIVTDVTSGFARIWLLSDYHNHVRTRDIRDLILRLKSCPGPCG